MLNIPRPKVEIQDVDKQPTKHAISEMRSHRQRENRGNK